MRFVSLYGYRLSSHFLVITLVYRSEFEFKEIFVLQE